MIAFLGLGVLVAVAMGSVDFAYAKYCAAIIDGASHRAARWSTVAWASATIGFVLAVRYNMWLVPFEGAGIYVGCWLGVRGRKVIP